MLEVRACFPCIWQGITNRYGAQGKVGISYKDIFILPFILSSFSFWPIKWWLLSELNQVLQLVWDSSCYSILIACFLGWLHACKIQRPQHFNSQSCNIILIWRQLHCEQQWINWTAYRFFLVIMNVIRHFLILPRLGHTVCYSVSLQFLLHVSVVTYWLTATVKQKHCRSGRIKIQRLGNKRLELSSRGLCCVGFCHSQKKDMFKSWLIVPQDVTLFGKVIS